MNKIFNPSILLLEKRCKRNIQFMHQKSVTKKMHFRPHFKTHQSGEIGKWFLEDGIKKITVSSLSMAEYFTSYGFTDITIAFPLIPLEFTRINNLANSIELGITVDNEYVIENIITNITNHCNVYLEIDTGYKRSGIDWASTKNISNCVRAITASKHLTFKGILVHNGKSYNLNNPVDIIEDHKNDLKKIEHVVQEIEKEVDVEVVSYGDTPTCTLAEDFGIVNEIRPGNFIFYDLMQLKKGVCSVSDLGIIVLCPVASTYPNEGRMVIYGGAIHFSKDYIINSDGEKTYGQLIDIMNHNPMKLHQDSWIYSLSQEHGLIKGPKEYIAQFKPGDMIGVVPVHACLTVDALKKYITPEGKIIDTMLINNYL